MTKTNIKKYPPIPEDRPGEPAVGPPRRWQGAFRGGPFAELRWVEQAWRGIWQRAETGEPSGDLLEGLQQLPVMADPPPWTAELVQNTIRAMSLGKAPGLDGWFLEEVRVLPQPLVGWLAQIYNSVESTGCWPASMVSPEGVPSITRCGSRDHRHGSRPDGAAARVRPRC